MKFPKIVNLAISPFIHLLPTIRPASLAFACNNSSSVRFPHVSRILTPPVDCYHKSTYTRTPKLVVGCPPGCRLSCVVHANHPIVIHHSLLSPLLVFHHTVLNLPPNLIHLGCYWSEHYCTQLQQNWPGTLFPCLLPFYCFHFVRYVLFQSLVLLRITLSIFLWLI